VKLVSFGLRGAELPGALVDGGETIVPLSPVLQRLGVGTSDMNAVLGLLPLVEKAIETGEGRVDAQAVRLGPPVPRPPKIVVCGMNYMSQVEEARAVTGGVPPRKPPLGIRPVTSLAGPFDPAVVPPEAQELDYEAELAVVVGRSGRRIAREDALDHVAGYMCAQDLTARDVMRGDTDLSPLYAQITRAKSFDSFCPTGPWLVTADEIPDPGNLRVQSWINGELRQDESTAGMLLDVPGIVEWVSSSMTLAPGDVLLTGTPAGTGASFDPPRYVRPGDVIRTAISGLGTMENRVEPEAV
jgi:2-keto-4-pentenoate hydratase/2-oxohepta-3-ene-1,7-dioic acid hydratase in catechol pathway